MTSSTTRPREQAWAVVGVGVVAFLCGQVAGLIGQWGVSAIIRFPGGVMALSQLADQPWWSVSVGELGLWAGLSGAIVWGFRRGLIRRDAHSWSWRWTDIFYVGLGVAAQGVVDLAYAPFHLKNLNAPTNKLFSSSHSWQVAVIGVITVIGAPIFEELFFRATIFSGLAQAWSSRRGGLAAAVVVSGLLFGAAHGEPLQFIGLAAVGVLLAAVLYRTQRYLPSIITHASFNGITFVALLLARARG